MLQQSLFGSVAQPATPETTVPADAKLEALSLSEAVYTVIDLETTGLNAKKNSITEITAIQYRNGEEIGKYSTLVKPGEPISEEVEMITGISNDMVKNAPAPISVLSELAAFVGPAPIIVGHNVSFDINFLREKLQQTGLDTFIDRFQYERALCTKVLAQKTLPSLPSYEGIMVATAVGYHNPNPHRAEADVRMSAGILFALFPRLAEQQPHLQSVRALLDWQGPLG